MFLIVSYCFLLFLIVSYCFLLFLIVSCHSLWFLMLPYDSFILITVKCQEPRGQGLRQVIAQGLGVAEKVQVLHRKVLWTVRTMSGMSGTFCLMFQKITNVTLWRSSDRCHLYLYIYIYVCSDVFCMFLLFFYRFLRGMWPDLLPHQGLAPLALPAAQFRGRRLAAGALVPACHGTAVSRWGFP